MALLLGLVAGSGALAAAPSPYRSPELVAVRDRLMAHVDQDRDYVCIMLDVGLSSLAKIAVHEPEAARALTALESAQDGTALQALVFAAGGIEARGIKASVIPGKTKDDERAEQASSLLQLAGQLVALENPRASAGIYRRALALTPDDADARYGLALAQTALGQADAADDNLRKVLAASAKEPNPFYQYWAPVRLADLAIADGNLGGVDDQLAALQTRIEALAAKTPSYLGWMRDLAQSWHKLALALEGIGDHDGALAAHRAGLAIEERLVASDPNDAQWEADLAHGDLFTALAMAAGGDRAGALATLEDAMTLMRETPPLGAGNLTGWHRDRGDVAMVLATFQHEDHQEDAARASLEQSVADADWLVRETSVQGDEQRRLLDILAKRETLLARFKAVHIRDMPGAIGWYGKARDVRRWLARDEPSSRARRIELATVCSELARVQLMAGHPHDAFETIGEGLELDAEVLKDHAGDMPAQAAFATDLETLGAAQLRLGNEDVSRKAFARAQEIHRLVLAAQTETAGQGAH